MNCHAARSILDLYSEDRLSPRWKRRVEAHLGRCAACAKLASSLRPAAAPMAAPASLKDRLRKAAAAPSPALPPLPRRASASAALFSLVLAGLLLALLHAAAPDAGSRRPVERPVSVLWRLP